MVAHAGMKEEMQGRGSGKVRDFALYGETTGETDEFGLPVRFDWASEYRGQAMVVYGHTPVPEPDWLNRTVNIDTGCVFGGKLTALRYPEKEFVSVPAARTYCEPARPFLPPEEQAPALSAQQVHDEVLDADDVLGKRIIPTRLRGNVTIREENATAALEVMSRFAADPEVADLPAAHDVALRDQPGRRAAGAPGRGVRLLPQRGRPAGRLRREAHGLAGRGRRLPGRDGRTGAVRRDHRRVRHRHHPHGASVLQRPGPGASGSSTGCGRPSTAADLWAKLDTTWACLDCELMPWSAKAQELLRTQYAAVGAAGSAVAAPCGHGAWKQAAARLAGEERDEARRDRGPVPSAGAGHRPVRGRLPAVLLACGVARRPQAGPVPPARHRGARPHGQGPSLAHGDFWPRSAGPTPNCCWRPGTRSWT